MSELNLEIKHEHLECHPSVNICVCVGYPSNNMYCSELIVGELIVTSLYDVCLRGQPFASRFFNKHLNITSLTIHVLV